MNEKRKTKTDKDNFQSIIIIHKSMWSTQRIVFITVGVLFHLFYLWSIFDIYFVSPLVHGMKHFPSTTNPPAKRLFLIVGDGLRADTTFDQVVHPLSKTRTPEYLAPFIRSMALENGTWGISHTRMPTESRPGHVAMIAGFYEDVSAVTKGWKENPVDFDSVFNQSKHTYSFGSPDILPMFKDGAQDEDKIDTWTYGHEFEDFTQSSIELDAYVFRHLYELMDNSTTDKFLHDQIHQEGNVFFLHLLGCDTAGHSYRPYSAEYYDNVKYIDAQVKELTRKVEDFFQDQDSAFVFTADHGMSAFGSHGDGHPNNTRTPLVAWGPGINKPKTTEERASKICIDSEQEDLEYTKNWALGHLSRVDVNQADITPLMSYLVGSSYPSNSVGELPLAFINASSSEKLHALYNNAKTILEQYLVKEQEVIASQFTYKPFHRFQEKSSVERLKEIEKLIDSASVPDAIVIEKIEELMKLTLEGLQYLTTYNWRFTRTIVTFGFVGWITYSFMIFVKSFILTSSELNSFSTANKDQNNRRSTLLMVVFIVIGALLNYVLFYQRSPFNFYMYLLFPLFFWNRILTNFGSLQRGTKKFFQGLPLWKILVIFLQVIFIFEGIVYGFFHRWIFTAIFNVLAFYPFVYGSRQHWKYKMSWIVTSICLSIFTLFDAVKIESLTQINLAGLLIVVSAVWGLIKVRAKINNFTLNVFIAQLVLTVLMILVTNKSVSSLQGRNGLPKDAQVLGWSIFVCSLVAMPLCHTKTKSAAINDYQVRMLIVYLTFAPTFIILTISFESFFYFFFSIYILQWIEIETNIKFAQITQQSMEEDQKENTKIDSNYLQILRISVIGFFLLQVAFFGTGNVASISSFSMDSVYRLIPIFDPFPMGALLMLKLIIPYVLLSTGLGILNLKLHIHDYTISSLIISISDILSLNFFYLLRTDGSWLDIGVTISNYCLAILSSLFMIILEIISHILLRNVYIEKKDTLLQMKKKQ